ncbi:MAG: septum formation initiator family protein [Spirochaetes bacterium]|nr:septum formation initiator family protein [Spirochaetota bacterium]
MKLRFLTAFYAGFFTYCILAMVFGPSGVSVVRDLERQTTVMGNNMEKLEIKSKRLSRRLESIRNDPETLRIEARSLGYVTADEGIIRLIPALDMKDHDETVETMFTVEPPSLPDSSAKAIAGSFTALVFLLSMILGKRPKGHASSGASAFSRR